MNKKIKLIAILMLALICLVSGGVSANFQSSPNVSATKKKLAYWMTGVRAMEASGQVMGLGETINSSTLVSSTSNNIDVHLQKNTEYGAMAILAVSDYGKQGNGTAKSDYVNTTTYGLATTTGNKSGIYGLGKNYEWVSGGLNDAFSGYNARYFNTYTTTKSGLGGDATLETNDWQGSNSSSSWISSTYPIFLRNSSSLFSRSAGPTTNDYYARAVVVCGSGF